jgi:uncharacterized protein (TIRG00374 family)
MKKWILAIVGIAISIAVFVLILSNTELHETASHLSDMGFRTPALLVCIYVLSFPIRAVRWYWILPPGTLTYSQSLKGIVLGFAGNNVLPARGGEFVRMEYLYRTARHIGRVTALSSIMIERIMDGLILLAVLITALAASPVSIEDYPWLVHLRMLAIVVFGLACAGSIVCRIAGVRIAALLRHFNFKIFHWAARMVERVHVATAFIGFNRPTLVAIASGILVWLIEGAMFSVACWHFGLGSESIIAGYLTLAIMSFGILIPTGPANVGLFQGMIILSLRLFGVSDGTALAMGLIVQACQFVPITLWGLLIISHGSKKRWSQAAASSVAEMSGVADTGATFPAQS